MIFLEILLGVVILMLLLPVTVLFVEVLFAIAGDGEGGRREEGRRPRIAVITPAHDEASVIAETLRSILPQLGESDRLLVVADNCSDGTAAIAAAEGAAVTVRKDPARRGKGYALDFGVRHLERDAPEVVIIIDADCQVAPGALDRLARACLESARPVQALYLMRSPKNGGLNMRIAEFAWTVKNLVRPSGLRRLGLPCQLVGTGMAFPWSCISTATLASGHIVEDLKLGIDLALARTPPLFCPEALVTSVFPASDAGILGQRTRWEHGHLGMILAEVPRLLLRSLAPPDAGLMALALDLSVPPLALVTLLTVAVWVASASFYAVSHLAYPLYIATAAAALLTLSVVLSWARYGRQIISLGSLALVGVYALWKVPLYARFLVARQLSWVRAKRDDGDGSPPPG